MVNIDVIKDLYRHMEWADGAVWAAILATPDSINDDKIMQYLYHLHMVQRAFLRIWQGESPEAPYPEFKDAKLMMQWARTWYDEAVEQLDKFDHDKLNQPMTLPWASVVEKRIGRPPEMTSLAETAMQVAMHTTYHRGQVNARLRELGGEPPLVDYIVWLWFSRPKAEWP